MDEIKPAFLDGLIFLEEFLIESEENLSDLFKDKADLGERLLSWSFLLNKKWVQIVNFSGVKLDQSDFAWNLFDFLLNLRVLMLEL